MDPLERYHIYTLLSAVVLVDRKILDVEIQAFVNLVRGLQTAVDDPNPDTDDNIKTWFTNNQIEIFNWLHSPYREINLLDILEKLRNCEYQWQILQAMRSVALSDSDFHSSEIELIRFVNNYWQEDSRIYIGDQHPILN